MPRFTRTNGNYFLAPTAILTGEVRIGELSSFWFGAVVRGDVAPIVIGRRVNVQDNAVIHCDRGISNVIEDDVTIGHGAIVHGKFVGEGSLIGMGATLLSRSSVGRYSMVAAGAVVSPDMQVPDGMMAMGVPAKIVRPVTPKEREYMPYLTGNYVELAQQYERGEFDPK